MFRLCFTILVWLAASLHAQPGFAADDEPFARWLEDFKHEAHQQGISQAVLDSTFAHTELNDKIVALDRKQPEGSQSLARYLKNTLTAKRYKDAQKFYQTHQNLLESIGKAYGVQPRFIAALWGIETNFGQYTGNFTVTDALATLAYDGRRSEFFRNELLAALRILESERMEAAELYGSWAGALGQCQFMPSTYLKYAVDHNDDGKRDVWHTHADVFASIANYLRSIGWNAEEGWGRPVKLPAGFDKTQMDLKIVKPMAEWKALGVTKADGSPLPDADIEASVVFIGYDGGPAPAYIVYPNFKALLEWNRSRYFATAVGMLADSLSQ